MSEGRFQIVQGDLGQKEKTVNDIALNHLRNVLTELVGNKDVKALVDPLAFGDGLISLRYMNIPLLAVTIYYYQQFPVRFPFMVNTIQDRPAILSYTTDNDLTREIYDRILGMEQFSKITATPNNYKGFQADLIRYLTLYIQFLQRDSSANRTNLLYQQSWKV